MLENNKNVVNYNEDPHDIIMCCIFNQSQRAPGTAWLSLPLSETSIWPTTMFVVINVFKSCLEQKILMPSTSLTATCSLQKSHVSQVHRQRDKYTDSDLYVTPGHVKWDDFNVKQIVNQTFNLLAFLRTRRGMRRVKTKKLVLTLLETEVSIDRANREVTVQRLWCQKGNSKNKSSCWDVPQWGCSVKTDVDTTACTNDEN